MDLSDANEGRVLAECYGQPFDVYSTKEFPGLEPSTELTKVNNPPPGFCTLK
jgi:hypothetical protein